MAYINKGDLLNVGGRSAVASGPDYTKLIREWSGSDDVEYATAVGVVPVVFTDTGETRVVRMGTFRKVAPVAG